MYKYVIILLSLIALSCSNIGDGEAVFTGVSENENFLNGTIKDETGALIDSAMIILYSSEVTLAKSLDNELFLTPIDTTIAIQGAFKFKLDVEAVYSIKALLNGVVISEKEDFNYIFNMILNLEYTQIVPEDTIPVIDTLPTPDTTEVDSPLVGKLEFVVGASEKYTTIQSAIDAASNNATITITAGVYEEQVTIDAKKSLLIIGAGEVIVRFSDIENTKPHDNSESFKEELNVNFLTNGAIRVLNSEEIVISNITVDGEEIYDYTYENIYAESGVAKWPNSGGNSGIAIFKSKNVTISECRLLNCYSGILVSSPYSVDGSDRLDNNLSLYSNDGDADILLNLPELSDESKSGNHAIIKNIFVDNAMAIQFKYDYDNKTRVIQNRFYNNKYSGDNDNISGGAISFFAAYPKYEIANNSFLKNDNVLSHQYFNAPSNIDFYNNIMGANELGNIDQIDIQLSMVKDIINCSYNCFSIIDSTDAGYVIENGFELTETIVEFGAGLITHSTSELETIKQNIFLRSITFVSEDPASNNFLVPDISDPYTYNLVPNKSAVFPEEWNDGNFIGATEF